MENLKLKDLCKIRDAVDTLLVFEEQLGTEINLKKVSNRVNDRIEEELEYGK